jgi:hypothetical protein
LELAAPVYQSVVSVLVEGQELDEKSMTTGLRLKLQCQGIRMMQQSTTLVMVKEQELVISVEDHRLVLAVAGHTSVGSEAKYTLMLRAVVVCQQAAVRQFQFFQPIASGLVMAM